MLAVVRPWAVSFLIGISLAIALSGPVAFWRAGALRDQVCRAAVTDLMDLNAGAGHIDQTTDKPGFGSPDIALLVVSADGSAVHAARCGFSESSLFGLNPVLQSVAVDDLEVSPIRLKLLGIALGITAAPT